MTYELKRAVRDCHVIVIGGAGFLGSHLVDHLCDERNCDVLVLDNFISGQLKHIHHEASWQHFDLLKDVTGLERICKSHGTKFVFNYAALPYIPKCYDQPELYFDVNAGAVLKAMNTCQRAGVQGFLQVSSAEIYGDSTGKANESTPVTPHSTYGVAKAAADSMVQVRWREAKTPAIAMRQFNCVGERETHEYVIPEIISQLHQYAASGYSIQCPVVKLGNNSTRDFQYAGDAVRMAVSLLEHGEFGEVYNMGSEDSIKIFELARMIGRLMGFQDVTILGDEHRVRAWEIWHLCSDNTKLYNTIPVRPQVPLSEALTRTIAYFRANNNRWDW